MPMKIFQNKEGKKNVKESYFSNRKKPIKKMMIKCYYASSVKMQIAKRNLFGWCAVLALVQWRRVNQELKISKRA
jgi:hypothetical protein